MSGLIPIPDTAGLYLLAIVVIAGLSGSSIASRLHMRLFSCTPVSFHAVYALVLAFTFVLATLVIDLAPVLGTPAMSVLAIPAGVLIGWGAFRIDRILTQHMTARPARATRAPRQAESAQTRFYRAAGGGAGSGARNRGRYTRVELVAAGALEELIFRGVFVALAFSLEATPPGVAVLVLSTLAFLFAHLHFGWKQVLIKAPLAVLALSAVLTMGTVLVALVAHMVLNFLLAETIESQRNAFAQPGKG